MKSLRKAALCSLLALAIGAFTIPAYAHAADGNLAGMVIGSSQVVMAEPGSVVLVPAPGVTRANFHPDQDIRDPRLAVLITPHVPINTPSALPLPSRTQGIHPGIVESFPVSAVWTGYPQGAPQSGGETINGTCTDTWGVTSDSLRCSGQADAWCNCQGMTLANAVSMNVTGVAVSISWPPGIGTSQGGTTGSVGCTSTPCVWYYSVNGSAFTPVYMSNSMQFTLGLKVHGVQTYYSGPQIGTGHAL